MIPSFNDLPDVDSELFEPGDRRRARLLDCYRALQPRQRATVLEALVRMVEPVRQARSRGAAVTRRVLCPRRGTSAAASRPLLKPRRPPRRPGRRSGARTIGPALRTTRTAAPNRKAPPGKPGGAEKTHFSGVS